jgi:HPt (histidine-containing phosphotransfer) domain-containing protein
MKENEPVIDGRIIADLSEIGGDGMLLERVLGLFEARVPDAVETIARLSVACDRQALADAVHGLKSMCASIGAARAAAACDELEELARTGGDLDAAVTVGRISAEVADAICAVRLLRAA